MREAQCCVALGCPGSCPSQVIRETVKLPLDVLQRLLIFISEKKLATLVSTSADRLGFGILWHTPHMQMCLLFQIPFPTLEGEAMTVYFILGKRHSKHMSLRGAQSALKRILCCGSLTLSNFVTLWGSGQIWAGGASTCLPSSLIRGSPVTFRACVHLGRTCSRWNSYMISYPFFSFSFNTTSC